MSVNSLITLDEAWAAVAACAKARSPAKVPLHEVVGHIFAEEVRADRDLPAADRSSMDGYAFAWGVGGQAPMRLRIAGEVQAGSAPAFAVGPGECARIFTGALLPAGTDTVVMQEDTSAEGDGVVFRAWPTKGAYVLRRGTDARAGDVLIDTGTLISPLHVALCATAGLAEVLVVPRPKVAILTTGEELRDAGAAVEPHQIRDSNRDLVRAQLRAAGFEAVAVARTGDDEAEMAAAAERLLKSADVLVMIGGMSVGRYDYAPAALKRLGATTHFHRIKARPGKPQLFATKGDRLVFGLPGNPLSVMVGLHELVLPALRMMSGISSQECRRASRVRLAGPVEGIAELVNFRPAILRRTDEGPVAEVLSTPRSSADLVTAAAADGFVIVPPGARMQAGEWADFRPWMGRA